MPSKAEVIVLVGPMGVGKTTVGKKLAKAIKVPFIDTDNLIVAEHGEISAIFAEHGEEYFRAIEESAVASAISRPGVVATGGGAVKSAKTRDLLRRFATVVYLATDGRHIGSRLRGSKRPLLANSNDWQRIYDERKPIYETVADLTVDTSAQPLKQTVIAIREGLNI